MNIIRYSKILRIIIAKEQCDLTESEDLKEKATLDKIMIIIKTWAN